MQKKKRLLKNGILVMLIGSMSIIGISYALWIQNLYQVDENTMATSCFNVTMEEVDVITLKNAYPIYDEDGKKLTSYTFTIKNNCEAYASYQVNLEVLNSSTLNNPEFIKVMLDKHTPVVLSYKEETPKTIENAVKAYKLVTDGLDVNESKTYELRLWIDEDVTLEDNIENSKFVAQIGITAAYSEKEITAYDLCIQKYGNDSTQCQILLAESDESLCPTVNADGTIAVSGIEDTNALLCSAPDDYGDSYYFRGVPENNYVKFGGYYWRILRINGDDSVRMIYAGDVSVIDALDETTKATVLSNGYDDSTTLYTQIGTSAYNLYWKTDNVTDGNYQEIFWDNAAVGYMYGNRSGITEGNFEASTVTIENNSDVYISKEITFDSTTRKFSLKAPIKLLGKEFTEDHIGYYTMKSLNPNHQQSYTYKIASITAGDSSVIVGYSRVRYGTTSMKGAQTNTNDSTIKTYLDDWYETNLINYSSYINDTLFCNDRSLGNNNDDSYSQLGYGQEYTKYRWAASSNGIRLICTQKNDRFTVNDKEIGNGDLTYPIGLIIADEVYMSGGYWQENTKYYLYTGTKYWAMSPFEYQSTGTNVRRVAEKGMASSYTVTGGEYAVRPVINLKPNVLKSGDGSVANPFQVEE